MKFFTDKSVDNPYLLIQIKDYLNLISNEINIDNFFFFRKYREVLIDPAVYELTRQKEYSWENDLNIIEFLDSLPDNHYFSADYPPDMNLGFTDLFLDKSWTNAIKYSWHKQYIATVQSQFSNYWCFTYWFDKYNNLDIASGILGLGGFCRTHYLNNFMKHALDYAFSHCSHKRIHIYGLAFRCIPYAYNLSKQFKVKLSVDSTKWTRPINIQLKESCGISCKKKDRQLYFDTYIQELKRKGVKINDKNGASEHKEEQQK